MTSTKEDRAVEFKRYFGALRPGRLLLILVAYVAPIPAALIYGQTLTERDFFLFWIGGDRYFLFGLVCIAVIWFSHAMVFSFTRVIRFRPLVLIKVSDDVAFDKGSREYFIVWSLIFGLYLALYCFLEWK